MVDRFGLPAETLKRIVAVIEARPEVERAILYGSRAKGTHRRGSDIDLTLVGDDRLTPAVMARIDEALDDLLLPYTFDLSRYADIGDPDVLDHIRRVGVEIYARRG